MGANYTILCRPEIGIYPGYELPPMLTVGAAGYSIQSVLNRDPVECRWVGGPTDDAVGLGPNPGSSDHPCTVNCSVPADGSKFAIALQSLRENNPSAPLNPAKFSRVYMDVAAGVCDDGEHPLCANEWAGINGFRFKIALARWTGRVAVALSATTGWHEFNTWIGVGDNITVDPATVPGCCATARDDDTHLSGTSRYLHNFYFSGGTVTHRVDFDPNWFTPHKVNACWAAGGHDLATYLLFLLVEFVLPHDCYPDSWDTYGGIDLACYANAYTKLNRVRLHYLEGTTQWPPAQRVVRPGRRFEQQG